ncbi:MAG TPA: putative sugar O-methyltransferase, partial [Caulobacteraceae bacterium]
EPFVRAGARPSLKLLHKTLGYGAARLPADVSSNRDLPQWQELMHAVETRNIKGLGKAAEHAAILHFLKQKEVFDEYVAWIDRLGIASNLGVARLYWYHIRLRQLTVELIGVFDGIFLEIGSGSGLFGIMLADRGLVRHYVMVDLPEMLLNAMVHVSTYLPDSKIRLGETPDFSSNEQTFWFLETGEIRKVPAGSVGVALNFNSFMEMDEAVRNFYIDEIYRSAAPDALFYNVNRRQRSMTRKDGRPFDNNPLLYPYRPTDRIIEWETDECQENCRSSLFSSPHPSFCISRIAEVGSTH